MRGPGVRDRPGNDAGSEQSTGYTRASLQRHDFGLFRALAQQRQHSRPWRATGGRSNHAKDCRYVAGHAF